MTQQIVTRAEAKSLGLKRYFTGVACKHEHIEMRITCSGLCVACSRENSKEAYRKNAQERRDYAAKARLQDPEKIKEAARQWRKQNPDYSAQNAKHWREQNPDRVKRRSAKQRKENPEYTRAYVNKWKSENKARVQELNARRRASKKNAVPAWYGELDILVWQEASDLCSKREAATGFAWHADHMVPLASPDACGLHVSANCQVIPAAINVAKGNKLVMASPLEWLRHL